MSTFNTVGTVSGLARISPRPDVSRAAQPAPASAIAGRASDSVSVLGSQGLNLARLSHSISRVDRASARVDTANAGLDETAGLLTELRNLVSGARAGSGSSEAQTAQRQSEIDRIVGQIAQAEQLNTGAISGAKGAASAGQYYFTNVSAQVKSFLFTRLDLFDLQSQTLNAIVTASAQVGGFFLSFGANNLNLGGSGAQDGANKQFTIEIGGAKGTRQLTFASGTTLSTFRNVINDYAQFTGVKAKVSSTTGVRLESEQFGTDGYVSVKVINDGAIVSAAKGIYNFQASNANASTTSAPTTYANAANAVYDFGQNVRANISGVLATGRGTVLHAVSEFWDLQVDLNYNTTSSTANAAKLGSLNLLTINRFPVEPPVGQMVPASGSAAAIASGSGSGEPETSGDGPGVDLSALASGGGLSLQSGRLDQALALIDSASTQVNEVRDHLGAVRNRLLRPALDSLLQGFAEGRNLGAANEVAITGVDARQELTSKGAASLGIVRDGVSKQLLGLIRA